MIVMDAPTAKSEPEANTVAEPKSDAYAAFWQCVDTDDATTPAKPADDSVRNAYEEYWKSVDCD
jgi:hypothetical protein